MKEKNKMRKKRNLIIGIIVVLVLLIIIYSSIRAPEKMFSPVEPGFAEAELEKANEKFIEGDFMDPGVYEEFFVQTSAEQIINSCKNGQVALDFFSCLRMSAIYKKNANEVEQICNEISEEACEIYYNDYSASYKQRCKENVPIIKESCLNQWPFYY